MKKTKERSQTKLIIIGFAAIATIQIVGFWYVVDQGVQRTQEVIESNLRHYIELEKNSTTRQNTEE